MKRFFKAIMILVKVRIILPLGGVDWEGKYGGQALFISLTWMVGAHMFDLN